MTKSELKKEIEKIKNKVGEMKYFDIMFQNMIYTAFDQKGCLLGFVIPKVLEYIEEDKLFDAYKLVTDYISVVSDYADILGEIQNLLEIEIKRHEKQIKVLRNKMHIGDMEVLNPRKDLKKETLYYISMDKTELSHNEYKLLKELSK